jgi:hypothetical protein
MKILKCKKTSPAVCVCGCKHSKSSVWVSSMCCVWLGRGTPRIVAKLLGNLSERCQMVEDFLGLHPIGRRTSMNSLEVTEAYIEVTSDGGQCPAYYGQCPA